MKGWNGLPLLIFGTGGCAKEVKLLVDDINNNSHAPVFNLLGFVSNSFREVGVNIEGVSVVTDNENFYEYIKGYPVVGVCLAFGDPFIKKELFERYLANIPNVCYPNLIHPSAILPRSSTNSYGVGNIICSGVNLTTNIKIGNNVLLNRYSTIGHDCIIGDYCTINPSATISGNIHIGPLCLIGAGASIKEKVNIGENSKIGLGAIVVKSVSPNTTVISKAAEILL